MTKNTQVGTMSSLGMALSESYLILKITGTGTITVTVIEQERKKHCIFFSIFITIFSNNWTFNLGLWETILFDSVIRQEELSFLKI